MTAIKHLTVTLPEDLAAFLDAQVASGSGGSESEVVRAGLRALLDLDKSARGAEDPLTAPGCARQAKLIRDAESALSHAPDGAWFAASDKTGWTA